MAVRSLDSLLAEEEIRGKRVFVRADLNVPISHGRIGDVTRIKASIPTLRRLLAAGARVVLCSHLGRPRGERVPDLSLRPVAAELERELGRPVAFVDDCVGESAESAAASLGDGQILLLENLRYHEGETKNDPDFARALARLADIYVNDAFGTAHRAHASTVGIVSHVKSKAAGDLLRSELASLDMLFTPERPFLCFLGGAKVSDKLGILEALIDRADVIGIGGAMAYTFLRARGESTGDSLVETDRVDDARRIMQAAEEKGCRLLLPSDHVVARKAEATAETRVVTEIPDGWLGLDIGPESAHAYSAEAESARTILWNGPMGMFEIEAFAGGTAALARAIAASSAISVVGGGDSLAAVNQLGVGDRIDHLSTGGGASLEYVQGLRLPGVAALEV